MKHTFILLLGAMLSLQGQAQDKQIPFQNTIKVEAGDSHADIIAKAAHVVPSPNQLAALQNEFIAFIHFGPNSFTRLEWGSGKEDPKVFDLKELDTDQWCEAMKAAGMKMVILTVKHHDGFVLWQSRYTKHGIMSTGFRDGKGDILKDLSESCRKYGLKLGVYLSPADLYHIDNPEGLYGNLSTYTKRTIPRTAFCQQDPFRIRSGRLQRILPQPTLRDPDRIRPDPRSMVRRGTPQAERRTDLQLPRLEKTDQGTCPRCRYLRTGRCPVVRQ